MTETEKYEYLANPDLDPMTFILKLDYSEDVTA